MDQQTVRSLSSLQFYLNNIRKLNEEVLPRRVYFSDGIGFLMIYEYLLRLVMSSKDTEIRGSHGFIS